jgi:hypothetical protein
VTHAEGLLPPRGRHAEVSTPLYPCCPQGDECLPGGDHGGLGVFPQMSRVEGGGSRQSREGVEKDDEEWCSKLHSWHQMNRLGAMQGGNAGGWQAGRGKGH